MVIEVTCMINLVTSYSFCNLRTMIELCDTPDKVQEISEGT